MILHSFIFLNLHLLKDHFLKALQLMFNGNQSFIKIAIVILHFPIFRLFAMYKIVEGSSFEISITDWNKTNLKLHDIGVY